MFLPWRNRGRAAQKKAPKTYPSTQNMALKWFQLYCIRTIINYYVLSEYTSSPSNTVHLIELEKSWAFWEKALKFKSTKAQCATLLYLLFCLHCKSYPYPWNQQKDTHTPPPPRATENKTLLLLVRGGPSSAKYSNDHYNHNGDHSHRHNYDQEHIVF